MQLSPKKINKMRDDRKRGSKHGEGESGFNLRSAYRTQIRVRSKAMKRGARRMTKMNLAAGIHDIVDLDRHRLGRAMHQC